MDSSAATRFPSVSRRLRLPSRGAWLGARATNVLRRGRRLLVLGGVAFTALLVLYLVLPRGVEGIRTLVNPPATTRLDTVALGRRAAAARTAVADAEALLAAARVAHARALAAATALPAPAADSVRSDSLAGLVRTLSALLQRVAAAPLTASYRALGESAALRADVRARALVDSLIDVERERDDLGGGATVDPVFVALTTRANELGRSLQALGEEELARLRHDMAAATPSPTTGDAPVVGPLPDTLQASLALGRARVAAVAADRTLASAHLTNAARDSAAAVERRRTQLAPLPVMLAGAAVVAVFLAFAFALTDEMRSPRVADAAEAERLSGLRVLTMASRREVPAQRARRAADRSIAPLLDPTSDEYRILAWHLTSLWPREGIVTVTGDDSVVSAIVGANLAAVLAVDARSTLLVDTDFAASPVRHVLQLPDSPGLAAVVANLRRWTESLHTVAVGRSRTMDVLPSGTRDRSLGPSEGQALVADVVRAARRHDATVIVSPSLLAQKVRAGDDVIVCAVQGTTRLATLARAVATLIDAGARVRGVVLWQGRVPVVALAG
ncbi:MAG: hypothetical protein IT361_10900 [Gemmatimonadaceae bacterium]|nr:hypothetical protein [Gemmatimonadaceae bacterium]